MSLRYSCATLPIAGLIAAGAILAEEPQANTAQAAAEYVIAPGTRIPLGLINSVSTKNAAEGDRVYLQTVFPILNNGRIVIPPGSWVAGTVTEVKRPGRVKGRGELYLRFDCLTLPNGVTRDFRARVGGIDGRGGEEFNKAEGKIQSEGNKAGDARTIAGNRRGWRRRGPDRRLRQPALSHGRRHRGRRGRHCRADGCFVDAGAGCRAGQRQHHRDDHGPAFAIPKK